MALNFSFFRRETPYQKRINKLKEEPPFSAGADKLIYENPDNPECLIAVVKDPATTFSYSQDNLRPFEVKRNAEAKRDPTRLAMRRFYIRKIVNLLTPDTVSRMPVVTTRPLTFHYMKVDGEPMTFSYMHSGPNTHEAERHADSLNEKILDIVDKLMKLELYIDTMKTENFIDAENGHVIYVDDLYEGEHEANTNNALSKAVALMPAGYPKSDAEKALADLRRITRG